jgi:hypothetical protein
VTSFAHGRKWRVRRLPPCTWRPSAILAHLNVSKVQSSNRTWGMSEVPKCGLINPPKTLCSMIKNKHKVYFAHSSDIICKRCSLQHVIPMRSVSTEIVSTAARNRNLSLRHDQTEVRPFVTLWLHNNKLFLNRRHFDSYIWYRLHFPRVLPWLKTTILHQFHISLFIL